MSISIKVRNADFADLYVWIWDLSTANEELLLNGERINSNDSIDLTIENNQDDDGLLRWVAQNSADPNIVKEETSVSISNGDTLSLDLFGLSLIENSIQVSSPLQVFDPNTVASVNEVFQRSGTVKSGEIALQSVNAVAVDWGEAELDTDKKTFLPNYIEVSSFEFTNDTDADIPKEETIRTVTKRTVSLESTKSITSSNEFKISLKLPVGKAGIDAGLLEKNQFQFTNKSTESFSEEITIESREKWVIPKRSKYTVTIMITKGFVTVPITGRMIIDANITIGIRIPFAAKRIPKVVSLASVLPNPEDRFIDYKGSLTCETYQKKEILHRCEPLNQTAPKTEVLAFLEGNGWVSSG